MSKKSLALSKAKKMYSDILSDVSRLPFTFVYDGKYRNGFEGLEVRETVTETDIGEKRRFEAEIGRKMYVSAETFFNSEFGEFEYTVWFENRGKNPSKVLSDVYCLDMYFDGEKPILRGNLGDHENWYAAYEHDLTKADRLFRSVNGRATHVVFPYFDLVHGTGGTMLALGWAGTWEALFTAASGNTHIKAKTDIGLNASLMPGEKVRTGLVVMLPYRNRNYSNATNLWREWFMKYNLPKADGKGNPLEPFSTFCWSCDTGLPNSDGSISERYFTWKPTLEKQLSEGLKTDYRWFDAGWYFDPYGETVETDWWGTIGSWELDRVKWPEKTFLESNETCHKEGMKVLTWFEPERVTHVDGLVKNYGYKEEWSIGEGDSRTNNLGNPECLAWTLGRITKMMGENGIDMYREDNNSNPAFAWPLNDSLEKEKFGIPRDGMTENKCICGHYALWDGIIDFCRENGKTTFVDSCASGGGRNDIESMRRGVPVMRSDSDRERSSMRLSQSTTLPRWIPFHGSSVSEPKMCLEPDMSPCPSVYVNRASFLPIFNMMGTAITQNKNIDFDGLRRNMEEWKSVSRLLTKDYYVLTPWHHDSVREGWSAFAYDDPSAGESILTAFRMEDSPIEKMTFPLQFAEKNETYIIRDADTGRTFIEKGSELLRGIMVTIKEKKSSKLLYINKKKKQNENPA